IFLFSLILFPYHTSFLYYTLKLNTNKFGMHKIFIILDICYNNIKVGEKMKIEIWSDFVCTFCYIGKRKLEQALENFDSNVEITYKAFQLDPSAKTEDNLQIDGVLAKKYNMSIEKAREMN